MAITWTDKKYWKILPDYLSSKSSPKDQKDLQESFSWEEVKITEHKSLKNSPKDTDSFTLVPESYLLTKSEKALKSADWPYKKSDKNNWLMTQSWTDSFKTGFPRLTAKCKDIFWKVIQKLQVNPKPLLTLTLSPHLFSRFLEGHLTHNSQNKLLISSNKTLSNLTLKSLLNKPLKKYVLNLKITDFIFIHFNNQLIHIFFYNFCIAIIVSKE